MIGWTEHSIGEELIYENERRKERRGEERRGRERERRQRNKREKQEKEESHWKRDLQQIRVILDVDVWNWCAADDLQKENSENKKGFEEKGDTDIERERDLNGLWLVVKRADNKSI